MVEEKLIEVFQPGFMWQYAALNHKLATTYWRKIWINLIVFTKFIFLLRVYFSYLYGQLLFNFFKADNTWINFLSFFLILFSPRAIISHLALRIQISLFDEKKIFLMNGKAGSFDNFDVICWIKSNPAIFSAFAPALLIFIFKFFENVTCKKIKK